ncbi:MAG: right-handed parallel beta-helix repeat-containing protein [Myxococcales bacterium]|nr:right-handed parallel beta-helix repeat-containing protein [Myxococcales bacterium]
MKEVLPMKALFASMALWLVAFPAVAQIRLGPADDVHAMLNALSPGDEVILEDGLYTIDGRFQIDVAGTAAAPIVIRAADGARPHFRQDSGQNIWDLDLRFVTLRGIEFSGGSAGLRFQSAEDVTVEDCEIHDTGDVALRMNDEGQTYLRVAILRNHIHHTSGTGEGMYLGCNRDGCRLADSRIIGNYVHHTNMGVSQGDGIELKEGSYETVIADNVVHDTGTGYPCITGYAALGNGGPNTVERNVVWSCGSHAIQWVADATIRNNILLSAADNGALSIQPNSMGTPADLVIVHNTILAPTADAIALRGVAGSVVVANNAVYAQTGRAIFVRDTHPMLTIVGNVGEGATAGFSGGFTASSMAADLSGASYSGAVPNDVFPRAGGGLIGSGDAAHVPADDFNGTARMGVADVGAYAYGDGTNPGWTLMESLKPAGAGPLPGTDAGVPPSTDAGPATADAGPPSAMDGGTSPGTDAGSVGGADAGEGGGSEGCACRATPSGSSPIGLLGLLGLWVLRRRRRG